MNFIVDFQRLTIDGRTRAITTDPIGELCPPQIPLTKCTLQVLQMEQEDVREAKKIKRNGFIFTCNRRSQLQVI